MRITINKVFPNMMLALGLASILLVSMPAQVAYSAPQTTTVTTSDGFTQTKTHDPATGEWKQTATKTDPQTGVTTTRNVSWKDGQSQPIHYANTTFTYPDGASRVETYDANTGKLTAKTDSDGHGSGSTWNYNPQTGGLTSRQTWSANDPGGSSVISYDGKSSSCKDVGDQGCMGHLTKTDISNGKTGQEYVRTYDQKGNETSNQVKDKAGNVTDIVHGPADTTEKTRDKNGKLISQKITRPDGVIDTVTFGPDGKTIQKEEYWDPTMKQTRVSDYNSDRSAGSLSVKDSTGKLISKKDWGPNDYQKTTTYDPKTGFMTSQSETQADGLHTVNYTGDCSQFGGSNCQKNSETVTDSKGKMMSKTDFGPNDYKKSTTYDPKTGFMTSQSETQADGKIHQVNYTGNCSQFGGSDCHKVSELTSDAKTGKITAAKFCDNDGNCKDADPKNLISAGGGPVQPGPQAAAGKTALAGDKPAGDRRASLPKVTKNADGSTTSVTNKPDGSTTTRTTAKDGSMKLVAKNADGSTSTTELAKDGKTLGIQTFDAKGKQTSATAFDQDGKKTLYRTFDDKGGSITAKYDANGVRLTSIDTIDANGKLTSVSCSNPAKCADAAKALNQQQVQISGAEKPPAGRPGRLPPALPGGKQNALADGAKQMGAKQQFTGKDILHDSQGRPLRGKLPGPSETPGTPGNPIVTKNPDGSTTYYEKRADGSTRTTTVDDTHSKVLNSPLNRITETIVDKTGKATTTTSDTTGKVLSTRVEQIKAGDKSAFPQTPLPGKSTGPAVPPGGVGGYNTTKPIGQAQPVPPEKPIKSIKKDIKSDVLKQIGGRAAKDFKTGAAGDLNPQPLPPGPPPDKVGKRDVKSDVLKQIGGRAAENFKKFGASGDLNPQPLPPGPPPDKVDKKYINTGVLGQIRGKSGVDAAGKSLLQLNPQPLPPDKVGKYQPGKSTSSGVPPGGTGGISLSKPIGPSKPSLAKPAKPIKANRSPANGGFVQPK